jgi:hypothetical protein
MGPYPDWVSAIKKRNGDTWNHPLGWLMRIPFVHYRRIDYVPLIHLARVG